MQVAQDTIEALGDSLRRSKSAVSRIRLARALRDASAAWDTFRDAIRVLRGHGLPRSVEEKRPGRRGRRTMTGGMREAETLTADQPGNGRPADPGKGETGGPGKEKGISLDRGGVGTPGGGGDPKAKGGEDEGLPPHVNQKSGEELDRF